MQLTVDLNCDLGEGAGHDAELIPLVTSANVACGAHAGSLQTMIETIECALEHGVAVGAHPGYFDLENFGRTEREITPAEASRLVLMQMEQCFDIAGAAMKHVKLHGALYHQVSRDAALADAVVTDLGRLWPEVTVFAPSGSVLARTARARGLPVAEEVFADRTYRPDGSLTPRSAPGAMIDDPAVAAAQVLRVLREGIVRTGDGRDLKVKAETICLHGDSPKAVAFARSLNRALKEAGVTLSSLTLTTSGKG